MYSLNFTLFKNIPYKSFVWLFWMYFPLHLFTSKNFHTTLLSSNLSNLYSLLFHSFAPPLYSWRDASRITLSLSLSRFLFRLSELSLFHSFVSIFSFLHFHLLFLSLIFPILTFSFIVTYSRAKYPFSDQKLCKWNEKIRKNFRKK